MVVMAQPATDSLSKRRQQLRLLLLQIRDEPRVRLEEHSSFCTYTGLTAQQIDIHNVFDKPTFDADILKGYDALLVGGASEASVLEPETYTFVPACIDLMRVCINNGLPVFASCFGYQLAVLALGGSIVRDTADFEMGCVQISTTEQAADDILLHDVPNPFTAVAVHRERSAATPPGTISLAYTDKCHHAFRVIDKPFWAFQFHPEVDRATLIERLTIFQAHYTEGEQHLQQVLGSAQETPHSNNLMKHFVDRVLLT